MSSPALLFADVVEKLKTTVQQGRSIDAAQVRVVGLDEIRAAAGDKWDAIKERVRVNSLEFLQGCLAQEDIVIPAGDGFLVLYADVAGRDLAREGAFLQEALNSFYLGEEGMQKLHAKVKGVSIGAHNVKDVLAFDGSDLALADEPAIPLSTQAEEGAPGVGRHQVVFSPVWTVAQEVIASYFACPAHSDQFGQRTFGYDSAYRPEGKLSGETFFELDALMLETAVAAVQACVDNNTKCGVGFNVHSTTMRTRDLRAAYLRKLAALPAALRKYSYVRIAEVEVGVPLITLTEWVGVLRGVCPHVSVELHPGDQSLQDLRSTGAGAFNFYLPVSDRGPTPEQRRRCAALIGKWTPTLHKQRLAFGLNHMVDPVLIEVARRAGVDTMTSSVVWPMVSAPQGVRRFAAAEIAAAFGQRRSA